MAWVVVLQIPAPDFLKRIVDQVGKPVAKGRWLKKGFWAVMDQGLFASSNFILNLLLARWLAPADYGAFGVAFAIFSLIGSLHSATLTEPMLVYAPGRYRERLTEYMGALVYGHLAFGALGSGALLVAGLGFAFWGSASLAVSLVALALAGPFILLLWLMRRACYALLEPRLAAVGGAWYMFLMCVGAFVLYRFGWLSTPAALGVMGISSLAVSLWLAVRLRVKRPPVRSGGLTSEAIRVHWEYGRWSLANKGLAWVPSNIFYLLLPVWGGLAAGASFKAIMNLLMPMLQANAALTVLLLPTLVQARQGSRYGSHVRRALVLFSVPMVAYWLLLGVFHQPLVNLLYGGRYVEYSGLLWLFGLIPLAASVKEVLSQSLRALERPDQLFWAYLFAAVVVGFLGVGLMYLMGIAGAGIGILLSQVTVAATVAVVLIAHYRRTSGEPVLAHAGQENR
jgi:O-antigen/teichoic acid export membrane protein